MHYTKVQNPRRKKTCLLINEQTDSHMLCCFAGGVFLELSELCILATVASKAWSNNAHAHFPSWALAAHGRRGLMTHEELGMKLMALVKNKGVTDHIYNAVCHAVTNAVMSAGEREGNLKECSVYSRNRICKECKELLGLYNCSTPISGNK